MEYETQQTHLLKSGLREHFFQGSESAVEKGSGYCRMVNNNMEYYEGLIKNYSMHSGLLILQSGDYLFGQYRERKAHGYMEVITTRGDSYRGEMRDGLKHGKGMLTFHDGGKFTGRFFRDKKEGRGYYHYPQGDIYKGEFEADRKHGFGKN